LVLLLKGEKYTVLNKTNQHWYLVKDKHGKTGYAPASYLKTLVYEKIYSIDKSHYGKE
jgi:uncharacterized protein YgiM (DUF1202 family)